MSGEKGAKTASQEAYAKGYVIANRFNKSVTEVNEANSMRIKKLTDSTETAVEGGTAGDIVDAMKLMGLATADIASKAKDIAALFDSKIAGMSSLKGKAGASQESASATRAAGSNLKK